MVVKLPLPLNIHPDVQENAKNHKSIVRASRFTSEMRRPRCCTVKPLRHRQIKSDDSLFLNLPSSKITTGPRFPICPPLPNPFYSLLISLFTPNQVPPLFLLNHRSERHSGTIPTCPDKNMRSLCPELSSQEKLLVKGNDSHQQDSRNYKQRQRVRKSNTITKTKERKTTIIMPKCATEVETPSSSYVTGAALCYSCLSD